VSSHQEQDIRKWIVDSASNAHITPVQIHYPQLSSISSAVYGSCRGRQIGSGTRKRTRYLDRQRRSEVYHQRCHVRTRQRVIYSLHGATLETGSVFHFHHGRRLS
jgi:hypothetical protein